MQHFDVPTTVILEWSIGGIFCPSIFLEWRDGEEWNYFFGVEGKWEFPLKKNERPSLRYALSHLDFPPMLLKRELTLYFATKFQVPKSVYLMWGR